MPVNLNITNLVECIIDFATLNEIVFRLLLSKWNVWWQN